jgi:MFS family permease
MSSTRTTERILLGAAFILSASNSLVFALMGNLQDEYGFSDAGLGFIAAAAFLMSFLMMVMVAPLADRGHAKSLLIVGTLLAIVANLIFATGSSLWVFVLARAIGGMSTGCFMPPAYAMMGSLSSSGTSERMGAMRGIELAGFVTGPVIGGFLVGPFGLRWPFVLFAGTAAVATLIVSTQHLPTLVRTNESSRLAFGLLRHRSVLVPILFLIAIALPVGIYDSLWDRFLTDIGASDMVVGFSLAAYAAPFVLLSRFGGRLADRTNRVRVAFVSLLFIAPLTATYGLFSVVWVPIMFGVLEASFQAAAQPAASGMLAAGAPAGRASAAQGLAGACNQLIAAAVAMLATWGYGHFSARTIFGAAGLGLLIIGLFARFLARKLPDQILS